jgi:hypothetical protein
MNNAREGELVTPRAKSLTLELAADPGFRYRVERGDALRLAARRPDGRVEVDYLQHRWVTSEEALQPLAEVRDDAPSERAESPAMVGQAAEGVQRRAGASWRLVAVALVLVVGVALALLLVRRLNVDEEPFARERPTPASVTGGVATQATAPVVPVVPAATPSPSAPAPTATATPPVVANLVVCDTTVDCGIAEGEFSRVEFLACLRVTPGGDGGPLVLVATAGDEPPVGAGATSVLARSGPVAQDPAFRCHLVQTVRGELTVGRYWLWALAGTRVLGRVQFVVE